MQWITILLVMLFLKLYVRTTKELSQHVASHVHAHQLSFFGNHSRWPTMQKISGRNTVVKAIMSEAKPQICFQQLLCNLYTGNNCFFFF